MATLDKEIDRGIELLAICQDLQSEKDGADRPALGSIDKSKTLDQFARDVSSTAVNLSALRRLIPMAEQLADLGRQLEANGVITVNGGDDYADAALRYFKTIAAQKTEGGQTP